MPSPAPSTVPVSSPITKLPPPAPSLSYRSFPFAICVFSSVSVLRRAFSPGGCLRPTAESLCSPRQDVFECHPRAADDADDPAGLRENIRADPVGRIVDPVDRGADGGV